MNLYREMAVNLPEGELGGLRIERFTLTQDDIGFRGRGTRPGEYTKLTLDGQLWMSDTGAERYDHLEAARRMVASDTRRVLVNGLGLGMVVKAALTAPHVERVDVVERDERVAELVGAHYARDPRVRIHVADAYEQAKRWPPNSHWDVAWSDIWPDLCTDNLPQMTRLLRSYGRRTGWHGCWGHELLKRQLIRERNEERQLSARTAILRAELFARS